MTNFYDVTVSLGNGLNTGIQKVVKAIFSELNLNEISAVVGVSNKSCQFFTIDKNQFDKIVNRQTAISNSAKIRFLNVAKPFLRKVINLMNEFHLGRKLKEDLQRFFWPNLSVFTESISSNPILLSKEDSYITFDAFWNSEADFHRLEIAFKANSKIIIFVHDLFPLSNPNWFEESSVIGFKNYFTRGVEMAEILLFSSNSVLHEFKRLFPQNKAKKFKLPMGVGVDSSYHLSTQPMPRDKILMIGTLEPRKNYLEILNWYEKWDGNENLVIVGRDGWKSGEIKKKIRHLNKVGFKDKEVTWKSKVTDFELQQLLNQAKIGICASLDEGYGLPLREFIAYGVPIVASDISVFREENYEGIAYFRVGDNRSLTKAVESQLKNPKYPKKSQLSTWSESYVCLMKILVNEGLSK